MLLVWVCHNFYKEQLVLSSTGSLGFQQSQFFIFSLSFDRRYIFLIQDYRGVIIHFWSQKGKPEVLLYGAGCVPTIDLSGSYVGSYVNREYTTFLKN